MNFTTTDLTSMDQRYRATFLNSLSGYRQVVLVGTKSLKGNANLAIFNSLIHIGANPPLWGLIFRPDTVQRHTLTNILKTREYTLNYMDTTKAEQVHQTSAKFPEQISEFEAVGLKEEYQNNFKAPFVEEAAIKIGMKFEEKIELKVNGTIMIIGSIQSISLDENIVSGDGFVGLHKADVLSCAGLDAYYKPQFLKRLTYAKPDRWPDEI